MPLAPTVSNSASPTVSPSRVAGTSPSAAPRHSNSPTVPVLHSRCDGSPVRGAPGDAPPGLIETPRRTRARELRENTRHLRGSFAEFVAHFSDLAEQEFDDLRSEMSSRFETLERLLKHEAQERAGLAAKLRLRCARCAELEADRQQERREAMTQALALSEDLSAMRRRLDCVEGALWGRADKCARDPEEALREEAAPGENLSAVQRRLDHMENMFGAWADAHTKAAQRLQTAHEGAAAELAALGEARAQHLEVEEFLDTAVKDLAATTEQTAEAVADALQSLMACEQRCDLAEKELQVLAGRLHALDRGFEGAMFDRAAEVHSLRGDGYPSAPARDVEKRHGEPGGIVMQRRRKLSDQKAASETQVAAVQALFEGLEQTHAPPPE